MIKVRGSRKRFKALIEDDDEMSFAAAIFLWRVSDFNFFVILI